MMAKSVGQITATLEDGIIAAVKNAYAELRDRCETVAELGRNIECVLGDMTCGDATIRAYAKAGFAHLLAKERIAKEEAASGN